MIEWHLSRLTRPGGAGQAIRRGAGGNYFAKNSPYPRALRGPSRHLVTQKVSGAVPSSCTCAVNSENAGEATVWQRYASDGARWRKIDSHTKGKGRTEDVRERLEEGARVCALDI